MTIHRSWVLRALVAMALATGLAARACDVTFVGLVSPEAIEVWLDCGEVIHAVQEPYVEEPGDFIYSSNVNERFVVRDGVALGGLVGPDEDILMPFDEIVGPFPDTAVVDAASTYTVASTDDPGFAAGRTPENVFRKSEPTDHGRLVVSFESSVRHIVFLDLPESLTPGATYEIQFGPLGLAAETFTYDPATLRSEAIHVSQIGFRPDDPDKTAFVSCWLGDGGGVDYGASLPFEVLDDATGAVVLSGAGPLRKAASDNDEDAHNKNYTKANVYAFDFSALTTPGVYRIHVPYLGCSYPFPVHDDVWQDAFKHAMNGLYIQRSGIPIGPPHSTFTRPRPFHPDDGVTVFASTARLMDTGNGIDHGADNFKALVAGATEEVVADAWGGTMDAGDWDRRIQHLDASFYLLDLAERFPDYFNALSLDIPESGDAVPDIIDEALFNVDFYRRLQTPAGGIRGGVESEEHPRYGEASWQESLRVFAYAPGAWSSFKYAAVAARAARLVAPFDAPRAEALEDSAVRAMEWAEAAAAATGPALRLRPIAIVGLAAILSAALVVLGRRTASRRTRYGSVLGGLLVLIIGCTGTALSMKSAVDDRHEVVDARNHAAAELFRLTGQSRWHDIFLETTAFTDPAAPLFVFEEHEQRFAAWTYVNTSHPDVNTFVYDNAATAIQREADERVAAQENAGFGWTKNIFAPPGFGAFSRPDAAVLSWAHTLTGDDRYLRAIVLACQTGAGANPKNTIYTTGLGHRAPINALHLDSRNANQPVPDGITVLGPADPVHPDFTESGFQDYSRPVLHPPLENWPALEAYWDVFWDPARCEFTIHEPLAQNLYVWGYLAAR